MNGNGGRAMPPWVRSVAYLISMLGFPIVVAAYLLLQNGGLIASPLTEVRSALASHVSHDDQALRLLRRICANTAKTQTDADRCDPLERGDRP